jgi:hypothetical protein
MSFSGTLSRAGAVALALLLASPIARAAAPTKEECVDAHGRGQDARESGQLVQAGKLFLFCADAGCPDLVRNDCARFADEIERLRPSVTFAARDAAQRDLPDTAVYLDGVLVAPRLGDGKLHEIDPGRHEVRFVHAGKETTLEVVINQGEKARALVGMFTAAPPSPAAPDEGPKAAPARDAPEMKRPGGPLILVGLGAAAAIAGGVLAGVGFARFPGTCSLSTHQCTAAPGDPVFGQAASSVTLVNVGAIAGGAGAALLTGSLVWYFAQAPRLPKAAWVAPWSTKGGGGLSLAGSF